MYKIYASNVDVHDSVREGTQHTVSCLHKLPVQTKNYSASISSARCTREG